MKNNIKIDLGPTTKQIKRLTDKGLNVLANQIESDSNKYAPKKVGDLRSESFVTFDNKHIVWDVPYAARMYYNQYKNYTEPGTGPKWVEKANAIHRNEWIKVVERAMKL